MNWDSKLKPWLKFLDTPNEQPGGDCRMGFNFWHSILSDRKQLHDRPHDRCFSQSHWLPTHLFSRNDTPGWSTHWPSRTLLTDFINIHRTVENQMLACRISLRAIFFYIRQGIQCPPGFWKIWDSSYVALHWIDIPFLCYFALTQLASESGALLVQIPLNGPALFIHHLTWI